MFINKSFSNDIYGQHRQLTLLCVCMLGMGAHICTCVYVSECMLRCVLMFIWEQVSSAHVCVCVKFNILAALHQKDDTSWSF